MERVEGRGETISFTEFPNSFYCFFSTSLPPPHPPRSHLTTTYSRYATQHTTGTRRRTQHHAPSRSITQHHAALRSTTQHPAVPRSTTQHHAAPRSTTHNMLCVTYTPQTISKPLYRRIINTTTTKWVLRLQKTTNQ